MPTYDYACVHCGGFEAIRAVAQRDEPVACPDCGSASPRIFGTAPCLALMASDTRSAFAMNERARHEPQRSSDYVSRKHPAGCGCCSSVKRSATVTNARGNKAFPTKRPWMISH